MKFNADHKKEINSNGYFKEGVHRVKIADIGSGKTDKGTDYIEFFLLGENGEEDAARIWFTDKSAVYSFNNIRNIFVHNAPEDKKDHTRNAIDALEDTESLAKACEMLKGKECWFSVYKNADRPYMAKDGSMKPSFDKNIYGYAPTEKDTEADMIAGKAEDLEFKDGNGNTNKVTAF